MLAPLPSSPASLPELLTGRLLLLVLLASGARIPLLLLLAGTLPLLLLPPPSGVLSPLLRRPVSGRTRTRPSRERTPASGKLARAILSTIGTN